MTTSIVYQRSFFADLAGDPLDNGSLYIGTANQDPETNPIQCYWDSGLTTPATQPLSISAGYVVNAGTRAAVYVNADSFSLRAKNAAGSQVDYVADANDGALRTTLAANGGAALIGTSAGITVQASLTALAAADTALDGRLDTVEASLSAGVTAPVNLAPNSQWEIFSGLTYDTRIKSDGSGVMTSLTVSAYTTGGVSSDVTVVGDISTWRVGDLVKIANTGTVDANLYSYPLRIQSIAGQVINVKTHLGATVSTALIGTPGIDPINIGCSASTATGDAADGWKKTAGLMCWREDNAANLSKGATYALGLMKQTGSEEYVRCELDAYQWRGRTICFGIGVNQKVRSGSGTWCAYVYSDGTSGTTSNSSDATTASGFQWLEKSYTVPTDATVLYVGIKLKGANADVYHAINPVIAATSLIGAWNYVKPDETLIPVVKVEPAVWINASITFPGSGAVSGLGYTVYADMHAASGGSIAKSVRLAHGNIEAINTNAVVTGTGGSRIIGWTDDVTDPIRLGPFLPQYVTNVKSFGALRLPMKNGQLYAISPVASDTWSNCSIDLDVFHLLNSGVPV